MAIESTLYNKYINEIRPELAKELKVGNMQIPKIEKIVINMGLGKAVNDKSIVKDAVNELTAITGQQAVATIAKVSNASFKVREGMPIGVKVTLRGQKMYDFLDKLINLSLPRIRDFRGVKPKAFDKNGNYTLGIKEYIIFTEIELDKVKVMKGCDISIVTSTPNRDNSYKLLLKMGMPFADKNKEDTGVKNG